MVQPVRPRRSDERSYTQRLRVSLVDPYFAAIAKTIETGDTEQVPAELLPFLPVAVAPDTTPAPDTVAASADIAPFPIATAAAVIGYQADEVAAWHTAATRRTLGKELGVLIPDDQNDPVVREFMEAWRRRNIDLISTIPDEAKAGLERRMARIPVGDRAALNNVLAQEYRVTGSRLRLITRDQTTKIVSGLNQIRQTRAGIIAYIWLATADERVRPSHLELNRQRFLWSQPPSIGHPGEPIQCRCVALPDFRSATVG